MAYKQPRHIAGPDGQGTGYAGGNRRQGADNSATLPSSMPEETSKICRQILDELNVNIRWWGTIVDEIFK